MSNNYLYSVNNKKWSIKTIEERKVNKLIQDLAISDFLARIICSRNIEISQAEDFIYPSLKKQLPSPLLLKDMNIAVERISREVRPQSNWNRSKEVLKLSVKNGMLTKTGLMVGLGETDEEVISVMKNMAEIGVKIFTIGQYLQPTKDHLPVNRYVHPEIFQYYKKEGLKLGFSVVESGPLVRSSYHAADHTNIIDSQAKCN